MKGLKNNLKALSSTLVIDANAHFKCAIFMRDLRLERAFSYLSLGQRPDGALFKYLSVWHLAKEGLATLLALPKIGQQSKTHRFEIFGSNSFNDQKYLIPGRY